MEIRAQSGGRGTGCRRCDTVNRGAAYSDGKVFINTPDGHTCAVDAAAGKNFGKQNSEISTSAKRSRWLVVNNKVLVGNSGGEFGVRGWLAALDSDSGQLAWKTCSTGPDSDVLIGPNFKPYYDMDKGTDLGVHTWPPEQWKIGGGNVWGWISYDPASNLIFYGTGNPGVWNPELRPGDNKWSAGIFARNPDTGEAVWFYQASPHDLYDHDEVNENVLVDIPINGQDRKVILHPGRNGYMYVLDRSTGQVLSATSFVYNTGSNGVDLATGRLIPNPDKEPQTGRVVREICPSSPGAKDWNPSAYSHRTGLLYIPHNNLCMDYEVIEANYIAGTPYVGVNAKYYAGPGGHRGLFTAWDPVNAKPAWQTRDAGSLKILLPISLIGNVAIVVVRYYEFDALHFKWNENAYGSAAWMILGLHMFHLIVLFCEDVYTTAWLYARGLDDKHALDLTVAAVYWYWIVGTWLVLFPIVYLVPRMI